MCGPAVNVGFITGWMRRRAGLDGVESGVVRADSKGCPGRGPLGPRAGGQTQRPPEDGAAGSGISHPSAKQTRQGVAWRLEPFKAAIDAMLAEDTTAPRKQRHTARRILARLIEEHGAEDNRGPTPH